MARVLFSVRMDEDRRASLAGIPSGAFEAIVLEDLPSPARESAWAEADVLVCGGFRADIPEDLPARAPRLRMVQVLLAGVDHFPFERLPPGAVLCSNAGAYNVSVAEHAMALLLAAAKDIPRRTEEIRRGTFDQAAPSKGLHGSTLVVLGLGGIGSEVARLGHGFGMRVLGISRSAQGPPAVAEAANLDDLPRFASLADFLVVALPLTRRTEGLIDRHVLAAMKDDAVLVNIARGKIIVEDDLYEHLKVHPRFRAALDVWWAYPAGREGRPFHRPFHELPNVLMTPHVAWAVPAQRRRTMDAALQNVLLFLRGERPRNIVDPAEYVRELPRQA